MIEIAREVADALGRREPVVALETTLVAHGFPAGEGIAVGLEAEKRVREAGAVPATIGVLDGRARVGLTEAELERFTPEARKVGPRDLAACAVQGAVGATTVGGTLAVCRAAGIGFMATGGIGGVHRGPRRRLRRRLQDARASPARPSAPPAGNAEGIANALSLDISADLAELARTEALVVCSGAKSLLDVAATAELLETLGVPVLGFQTEELPLFYSARGGPPVSARIESAGEAAEIARAHWELGRHSSLIVARPPDESLEVEHLIEQALGEAREQGVSGQAVTPFVLARLHELSNGRTLAANRELVAANAALAAEIAAAYR